jgi:hypothetical protein
VNYKDGLAITALDLASVAPDNEYPRPRNPFALHPFQAGRHPTDLNASTIGYRPAPRELCGPSEWISRFAVSFPVPTPDAGGNADGRVKPFREVGLVRESRGKRDLAQRLVRRKHEFLGSLDATFDHEGMRADAEALLEGTLEVPRTQTDDGR